MQEFDESLEKIVEVHPVTSIIAGDIDKCYMLKDDYVVFTAEEFNMLVDDLFWFIFETNYGEKATTVTLESGETVTINDVTSFYEWFSGQVEYA